MSDTDGSLYGGDSAEDLVGNKCQLVVTSLSPKSLGQLTPQGVHEESVFSATTREICSSTPVRDCFSSEKRSFSFPDINMADSDDDNIEHQTEKDERKRAGLSVEAPRRFVDHRLEKTMPELSSLKLEETFEVRRMRDAWRKIQVCLVINAYRKAKATADEMGTKLREVQNLYDEAVGKLRICKLDAVTERAKAEEVRKDLAAALNQLDHQQLEVEKLGLKARNMEALCIKLEDSVRVRDDTVAKLQAELCSQKEQLRKAAVALAEKDENVRSMGNKIEGLEKKAQELEFCVTKAEELNKGYTEQLKSKSEELSRAQQNICGLIDAKTQLEDYLRNLQLEVDEMKEDMADHLMTEDVLNKTIDKLNVSLTVYESDRALLRENLTVAKVENFNLKRAILEKHLAVRMGVLKHQPRENMFSVLFRHFVEGLASTFMPFQTSFVRYL